MKRIITTRNRLLLLDRRTGSTVLRRDFSSGSTSQSYGDSMQPPPQWAKFPDGSRFWKTANGRLQRPIFVAATRQQ